MKYVLTGLAALVVVGALIVLRDATMAVDLPAEPGTELTVTFHVDTQ